MEIRPQNFVHDRLRSGDVNVVVAMIESFLSKLSEEDYASPSRAGRFASRFFISLLQELDDVDADHSVEDSPLLTVWRDLSYLGVERSAIAEFLEGEHPSEST